MIPRISLDVCKEAFARWIEHNAARLGAALAYYTLLSLAPLLIFVVAVGAAFLAGTRPRPGFCKKSKNLSGRRGPAPFTTFCRISTTAPRPAFSLNP